MPSVQTENTTLNGVMLTVIAVVTFAANSLLCRQALGHGLIDAATFTSVRVLSGALTLSLIVLVCASGSKPPARPTGVAP